MHDRRVNDRTGRTEDPTLISVSVSELSGAGSFQSFKPNLQPRQGSETGQQNDLNQQE